jgi:hypothetical protein
MEAADARCGQGRGFGLGGKEGFEQMFVRTLMTKLPFVKKIREEMGGISSIIKNSRVDIFTGASSVTIRDVTICLICEKY